MPETPDNCRSCGEPSDADRDIRVVNAALGCGGRWYCPSCYQVPTAHLTERDIKILNHKLGRR